MFVSFVEKYYICIQILSTLDLGKINTIPPIPPFSSVSACFSVWHLNIIIIVVHILSFCSKGN